MTSTHPTRVDVIDRALGRCRVLAALAVLASYRGLGDDGGLGGLPAAGSVAALLLATNWFVFAPAVRARLGAARLARLSITIDLAVVTGALVLTRTSTSSAAMLLVLLPTIEAAVRFRVAGAVVAWFAASSTILLAELLTTADQGSSLVEFLGTAPYVLLAALPVAYVAAHLTAERERVRRAERLATRRAHVLAELAMAERTMTMGTERDVHRAAVDAAVHLGARGAEVRSLGDGEHLTTLRAARGSAIGPIADARVLAAVAEPRVARTVPIDRDDTHQAAVVCAARFGTDTLVLLVDAGDTADGIVLEGVEILCDRMAVHTDHARRRTDLDGLLRRADAAMYRERHRPHTGAAPS